MTVTVVQSISGNTTTDPATITLGATPTAGNTLVAFMASDTTIQTSTFPTAGSGKNYTLRASQIANQGWYVWTRLVVSGDAAATTFDITGANPAALMVIEVSGTYDKVGTIAHVINSSSNTQAVTGLSPATIDNLILTVVGMHNLGSTLTAASADNGFTLTRLQSGTVGAAQGAVVVVQKATGATTATGTTTVSWSGSTQDRDGVQIAFTGIAGGAAANPRPLLVARQAVNRAANF